MSMEVLPPSCPWTDQWQCIINIMIGVFKTHILSWLTAWTDWRVVILSTCICTRHAHAHDWGKTALTLINAEIYWTSLPWKTHSGLLHVVKLYERLQNVLNFSLLKFRSLSHFPLETDDHVSHLGSKACSNISMWICQNLGLQTNQGCCTKSRGQTLGHVGIHVTYMAKMAAVNNVPLQYRCSSTFG